jgi:hypothetical protein
MWLIRASASGSAVPQPPDSSQQQQQGQQLVQEQQQDSHTLSMKTRAISNTNKNTHSKIKQIFYKGVSHGHESYDRDVILSLARFQARMGADIWDQDGHCAMYLD